VVDDAVELADVIGQLRSELGRAMAAGEGEALRFEAEGIELELTVAVERSREPGVKARFWVLDLQHAQRSAHLVTQRLNVRLKPVRADAPERSALISGAELADEI
jgi:hypothetical protein